MSHRQRMAVAFGVAGVAGGLLAVVAHVVRLSQHGAFALGLGVVAILCVVLVPWLNWPRD